MRQDHPQPLPALVERLPDRGTLRRSRLSRGAFVLIVTTISLGMAMAPDATSHSPYGPIEHAHAGGLRERLQGRRAGRSFDRVRNQASSGRAQQARRPHGQEAAGDDTPAATDGAGPNAQGTMPAASTSTASTRATSEVIARDVGGRATVTGAGTRRPTPSALAAKVNPLRAGRPFRSAAPTPGSSLRAARPFRSAAPARTGRAPDSVAGSGAAHAGSSVETNATIDDDVASRAGRRRPSVRDRVGRLNGPRAFGQSSVNWQAWWQRHHQPGAPTTRPAIYVYPGPYRYPYGAYPYPYGPYSYDDGYGPLPPVGIEPVGPIEPVWPLGMDAASGGLLNPPVGTPASKR